MSITIYSFSVTGEIVASQGSGQSVELKALKVETLGTVMNKETYPMSKKAHTLEHLRQHAHLRPRSKVHAAAMRIRHAMAFATHKFFNDSGFLYIHTPIITCADCEGAGEQFGITTMLGTDPHKTDVKLKYFEEEEKKSEAEAEAEAAAEGGAAQVELGEDGKPKESVKARKRREKAEKKAAANKAAGKDVKKEEVEEEKEVKIIGAVDYTSDFFGKRANLTVSGQLNVETHCCALSDVYTFGPTFRAENSHTTRHLAGERASLDEDENTSQRAKRAKSTPWVQTRIRATTNPFAPFSLGAEFWMIEPEVAFADLNDDVDLAEDYIKYCVKYALDVCAEDIAFFETSPFGEEGLKERLLNVLESPFKRLTYTEGIKLLQGVVEGGHKFENSEIVWGMDLGR